MTAPPPAPRRPLPAPRLRAKLAGWPAALPFDDLLRQRAKFELNRTSVQADYIRRSEKAGLKHRQDAGFAMVGLGVLPFLIQLAGQAIGFGPAGIGVLVGLMLVVQVCGVVFLIGRLRGPSLRAGLRRLEIDCCVRCGQMINSGTIGHRCPECGLDHGAFPLGWGPGPIQDGAVQPPN
ncbi:MAG: hypothetical protein AB8G96_15825 [Phycisphaerales bacterium]